MEDLIKELEKLKSSWENQKNSNLKEARICDAYIHAFDSAIQLARQEQKKPTSKKKTTSE